MKNKTLVNAVSITFMPRNDEERKQLLNFYRNCKSLTTLTFSGYAEIDSKEIKGSD